MALFEDKFSQREKRDQYEQIVSIGGNLANQNEIIKSESKKIIDAQIVAADSVIVSQDRIIDEIKEAHDRVDNISIKLNQLNSVFRWGFSSIIWKLEKDSEKLQDILGTLRTPLQTQGRERRVRGEEAFVNEWIDDAEEEFLEAAKCNKYDFSIYISLGVIYLNHKIDIDKALFYFDLAIKYAKPYSDYYTAYALLHKAFGLSQINQIEGAEKATFDATFLAPELIEIYYQNAAYNAQLGNTEKCISSLTIAIGCDKYYCLRVENDERFSLVKNTVDELLEFLRYIEERAAEASLTEINNKYSVLKDCINNAKSSHLLKPLSSLEEYERGEEDVEWGKRLKEIDDEISRMRKLFSRNSYYDFLEINNQHFPELQYRLNNLIRRLNNRLSDINKNSMSKIRALEAKVDNIKKDYASKKTDYNGYLFLAIVVGSFLVPFLSSIFFMSGWGKLWSLYFIIPVLSQLRSISLMVNIFHPQGYLSDGDTTVAYTLIGYFIALPLLLFISIKKASANTNKKIKETNQEKKNLIYHINQSVLYIKKVSAIWGAKEQAEALVNCMIIDNSFADKIYSFDSWDDKNALAHIRSSGYDLCNKEELEQIIVYSSFTVQTHSHDYPKAVRDCVFKLLHFFSDEAVETENRGNLNSLNNKELKIGDEYNGGIIVYFFKEGDDNYIEGEIHGIIVSKDNLSGSFEWSNITNEFIGNTSDEVGGGVSNTYKIISQNKHKYSAAAICSDYLFEDLNNWCLPSKNELKLIFESKKYIPKLSGIYWASSEFHPKYAWAQDLDYGIQTLHPKNCKINKVRAIRYF